MPRRYPMPSAAFYKALGAYLNYYRRCSDRGDGKPYSQAQLGKLLGFSDEMGVLYMEHGKREVTIHQLVSLADILKVNVARLIPGADVPEPAAIEDQIVSRDAARSRARCARRIAAAREQYIATQTGPKY